MDRRAEVLVGVAREPLDRHVELAASDPPHPVGRPLAATQTKSSLVYLREKCVHTRCKTSRGDPEANAEFRCSKIACRAARTSTGPHLARRRRALASLARTVYSPIRADLAQLARQPSATLALSEVRRNLLAGDVPDALYAARVAPKPALARGAICRPFVIVRRVIQICLDGRLCPSEPARDLGDRQVLFLAIVAGMRRGSPPLVNSIVHLALSRAGIDRRSCCLIWHIDKHPIGRTGQPPTAKRGWPANASLPFGQSDGSLRPRGRSPSWL